jgi:glycerophosphoryl diester phosphodiesterase
MRPQPVALERWPRLGPKQWLGFVALALGGLCVIGAWAIMVRVCPDAKSVPPRNYRTLPFFAGLPPVLDIAHRGASKLAPEHTLEAYRLALEQGAHVLELDLRLLRDRELVIAHDRTLRRTHGVEVAYSDLAWADLERLDSGHLPIRLAQALRQFPSVRFNLELKDETPDAARALAGALAETGAESRVLVASSHEAVLVEFRRATAGRVATSASTAEALGYYVCYLMQRPCAMPYSALQLPTLEWLGVTRAGFVAEAHERGLAVHFWTVDDPDEMRALLAAGADGIMTNRPDVLATLLRAQIGSSP